MAENRARLPHRFRRDGGKCASSRISLFIVFCRQSKHDCKYLANEQTFKLTVQEVV